MEIFLVRLEEELLGKAKVLSVETHGDGWQSDPPSNVRVGNIYQKFEGFDVFICLEVFADQDLGTLRVPSEGMLVA